MTDTPADTNEKQPTPWIRFMLAGVILLVAISVILLVGHRSAPAKTPTIGEVGGAVRYDPLRTSRTASSFPLAPTVTGIQRHFHVSMRLTSQDGIVYPQRGIGYVARGELGIHTHDESGVVHIHQIKTNSPFHLDDIWKAWGLRVTPSDFASLGQYCLYQNGKLISSGTNPLLSDRQDYIISFGTCKKTAPLGAFNWNATGINLNER